MPPLPSPLSLLPPAIVPPPDLPPDAWSCFAFQYIAFAIVIGIGLILVWRQGDVGFSTPRRRRNLALIVGGYVLYAGIHGFFQFYVSRL